MDHRRHGDYGNDDDGHRRKKRRSRSVSPVSSRLRYRSRHTRHRRAFSAHRSHAAYGDRPRGRSGSRSQERRRPAHSYSHSDRRASARSRSRSGGARRRHSRGPRPRRPPSDCGRDRYSSDNYAPPSSRSRSHSGRSHRSDRDRGRHSKKGRREHRGDYEREERDESDDSSRHDDTVGSFEGRPGEYLAARYKIIREAGLGTFGRVLECVDKQRNLVVAIKVIRKVEKYCESAKIEAGILQDVNDKDVSNSSLCVRMYKWFEFKGHVCIVFERLGCSLYDYLKAHDYQPFPLHCIRAFAWQLLTSLAFIHSINLIHTDLKPENILLVDDEENRVSPSSSSSASTNSSPNGRWANGGHHDEAMTDVDSSRLTCRPPASNAVRLIDFGGATYDDEPKSSIINTRQYRSPEVILGLGWSFPSDIWSAGCIIAELYIGELLFATHDNLEHLALIERCIGQLPTHMIDKAASYATKFFRAGRLNWPAGAPSDESEEHVRRMRRLDQILRPEDAASGLLDLLQLMLILDPEYRITAREALNHTFFDGFSARECAGRR